MVHILQRRKQSPREGNSQSEERADLGSKLGPSELLRPCSFHGALCQKRRSKTQIPVSRQISSPGLCKARNI